MRKGWEYKKLGEVCTLISDGSHNPPKGIDHSLYRMISSQNVFDDNLQITEDNVRYITESDHLCENKRTKLQKDVVLLTIVGTIGRSCVLKGNEGCLTLQRSVAALHPSDQIMPRFLMHCLIGNRHTLNQEAHGIAQKGIYLKQLSSLSIPLPPQSTQLAIVSELDKINELIRLKKEQLKDFDNLAQSLFYEVFGDPVENEKGWEVKKLGDISSIGTGSTPNRKNKDFYKNGTYPWVKSTEVCNLPIYSVEEYITEEALKNSNCTLYPPNTILMAMYGQGKTRGQIGLLKIEACTNQAVAAIMPTKEVVDEIFLSQHLMLMYEHIRNMARGGNQANLNLSIVKSIQIFLPPLSLQRLFAQRIEQIEREKSEVQKSIQDLETLLASRMQYWFE